MTFEDLEAHMTFIGEVRKILAENIRPSDPNSRVDGAASIEKRTDGKWRCGLRCHEDGNVFPDWADTPELAIDAALKELRHVLTVHAKQANQLAQAMLTRSQEMFLLADRLEKKT